MLRDSQDSTRRRIAKSVANSKAVYPLRSIVLRRARSPGPQTTENTAVRSHKKGRPGRRRRHRRNTRLPDSHA